MSPEPGSLNPQQRRNDLTRMAAEELDVLVIGGGVTGVGCALDAVTRGLSVGLVEQRDLASGTSSRSSKLMHGGLRYLEQKDFALVHEALQERGLLRSFYRDYRRDVASDPTGQATLRAHVGDDLVAFQREWERWVMTLRYG